MRPPASMQLDDDLGVEVEVVGVALERDPGQRGDRVGPVARSGTRERSVPSSAVLDARSGSCCRRTCRAASRRAGRCPRSIIREPNTASASPRRAARPCRAGISGAYWPSPCSSTTMSRPCSMAHAVAGLLVAAVAEVLLVPDDGESAGRARRLPAQADAGRCRRLASSDDEDLGDPGAELSGIRSSVARQRRLGVVGHDQDADARRGRCAGSVHGP